MSSLDKAVETQLNNIQTKTGKTLAEFSAIVKSSGLTKHSELRAMLQKQLGLGYGDANAVVHYMCNFIVKLTDAKDVDKALIGWIKQAYDQA